MAIRSLRGAAGALVFFLGGCSSLPSGTSTPVDRQLWPAPQGHEDLLAAATLDRGAFVQATLARNPAIDVARRAWRAAAARERQAGALEDPMAMIGAAPLSVGSSRIGVEGSVSQRVPWPGKRALEEAVARAETEAAKSDAEVTRLELALTAALLFDQYALTERSIALNAQLIQIVRELERAALARVESGRGAPSDAVEAQTELARLERDALQLTTTRMVTIAQMNELLHRPPDSHLPPPSHVDATAAAPCASAERAVAAARGQRSEIEALRRRARAEDARASRASRERFPDFSVGASYNTMWDMPEHRFSVSLGANVPIQIGRRAGAVEEAAEARARYSSEAARAEDKIVTEAWVAFTKVEEARKIATLYDERLVPLARDRFEAARVSFAAGGDFTSVLAAERALRTTLFEHAAAHLAIASRSAELERAMGRVAAGTRTEP